MSKAGRLYKIEHLIRSRGHVSFRVLRDELEVSPATLKRDLEYLRSRLGAPIEYDAGVNGYRLAEDRRGGRHELPGLWFDERELYSLLMAHQLLAGVDAEGTLSRHLQPLLERIQQLLAGSGDAVDHETLMKRVRIVSAARRPVRRRPLHGRPLGARPGPAAPPWLRPSPRARGASCSPSARPSGHRARGRSRRCGSG